MFSQPRSRRREAKRASNVSRRSSFGQLTRVSAVTYSLGQCHDPLDLLFLRQVRGVDEDGVGRLDRLGRITSVAPDKPVGLLGDLFIRRAVAELLEEPATGPLPGVSD